MRIITIVLVSIAAATIILPICYLVAVGIGLHPRCAVTELDSGRSPDGQYAYTVFQKDCGATTGFATSVAIRHADQAFDDDEANVALILDGTLPVQIHWPSNNTLAIEVPRFADIFRQIDKWEDVRISVTRL